MLTLKALRDNPELIIKKLAVKNFDATQIVADIIRLDDNRKALQQKSDALLGEQKKRAAAIGELMKQGLKAEAEAAKAEVAALKAESNDLLAQAEANNKELEAKLVLLPNTPCDQVPEGKGAEDNVVVRMGGPEPVLPKNALPHWELAKKYDIIDFDLGVKITGAGFPVYFAPGHTMASWRHFLVKSSTSCRRSLPSMLFCGKTPI